MIPEPNTSVAAPAPATQKSTSSLAIASLVFGVLAWLALPILGAIIAVVTGHKAKGAIRNSSGALTGDALATAGLILGYPQFGLGFIGLVAILIMSGVFESSRPSSSLIYYWTPGEMLEKGELAHQSTIRLGGIVQPRSVKRDGGFLTFRVSDNSETNAPSVLVKAEENPPPEMFREGAGVVVEGRFDASSVFKGSRIMVKHSNEYRPPKRKGKAPDWKTTLAHEGFTQGR